MTRRLAGFMIDCQGDDLARYRKFWSGALGLPVVDPDEGDEGRYALLGKGPGGWHIEVQCVEHASRLHLDIEADDIDAEATRLEALGAKRIGNPRGRWWVMEQQPGPVNWAPYNPSPKLGMVRLWQHETFAHGGSMSNIFRWREVPFAQEQMHAAMLRRDNVPDHAYLEQQQVVHEDLPKMMSLFESNDSQKRDVAAKL